MRKKIEKNKYLAFIKAHYYMDTPSILVLYGALLLIPRYIIDKNTFMLIVNGVFIFISLGVLIYRFAITTNVKLEIDESQSHDNKE